MFEPFREFPDRDEMVLETRGRQVTIRSSNLTHMVVWTDAKGDYLCIEPTLHGNGFDSTRQGEDSLAPGEAKEVSYSISW